jgi:hypothetical protein
MNSTLKCLEQTAEAANAITNPLGALDTLLPAASVTEIGAALQSVAAGVRGGSPLEQTVAREVCIKKLKELGSLEAPARLVDAAFAPLATDTNVQGSTVGVPARRELPDDWYAMGSKEYVVRSSSGGWHRYNEQQYRRILKSRGNTVEPAKHADIGEVDWIIVEVQDKHAVSYVGRLAGWREGVHTVAGGRRILVTESPRLVTPQAGDWSHLRTFIESLLGNANEQIQVFYGWLKVGLEALYSGPFRPGQAVVFAGPRNNGKSLLQRLLTQLFGGFFGRPFEFMSGRTSHNMDLFEGVHLVIEDDIPSTRLEERRKLGARIKEITANSGQRCHPKFVDAMILEVLWRMTISVNIEPENLMILPPLDESLLDKLILFKTSQATLPNPTQTKDGYKQCMDSLTAGLPAFVAFLQAWDIPDELKSGRYGVREYHHPELVQALNGLAPETKLAEIIDMVIFSATGQDTAWTGRASELERKLRKDETYGGEVARLLSFTTACGSYLARLAKKKNTRVSSKHQAEGNIWVIEPPPWGAGPGRAG